MKQSLFPTPTVPFNLQAATLMACYRLFVGATALASLGRAQTLDVSELNTALENSLTTGRDAGKDLTCTAAGVFLDSTFMKFVFGAMITFGIISAFAAWYMQSRNGTTVGRVFWVIIVGMVVVALIGVLFTSFMNC